MKYAKEEIATAQERAFNHKKANRRLPAHILDAWEKAINKASGILSDTEQQKFVSWDKAKKEITYWSKSDVFYEIGENKCQCLRFRTGQACYHLALWLLISEMEQGRSRGENVPYLPPTGEKKTEKVGNYRI